MIAPNQNRICEQAKIYYYDFLFEKDKEQIPGQVLIHFRECHNCQRNIYELKAALVRDELRNQNRHESSISALTNNLKTHFSYIDKEITCKVVKPFLPSLLDSTAQINIPTPITTHIDNCPECVHDLGIISDLNLDNLHLQHLGKLLGAEPDDKNIVCKTAKADIMAFVMMAFQESNEQILKHLCSCHKCRESIYQYRNAIREELLLENRKESCLLSSRLTNNDIFDLAIPYMLDIRQYKSSEFWNSRTSHIRRCPLCLEKMQELHRTVFDIDDRPDSDIVTTYNIENPAETVNVTDSDELYAGYPIQVEVATAQKKAAERYSDHIIHFTKALKHKIMSSHIKSLSRTGFAGLLMAAIILSAMFLYAPKAKAFNLAKIFNAFEHSNNVHISTYSNGLQYPINEQWISRSSNIRILKDTNKITLFDINSKTQFIKKLNSEIINKISIPDELLPVYEKAIYHSLAFTSFYDISNIPADAKWEHVTTESQEINGEPDVYELTYISQNQFNDPLPVKLSFTLKPDSDILTRVDFSRKYPGQSDYSPENTVIINYLSNQDFAAAENDFFGK